MLKACDGFGNPKEYLGIVNDISDLEFYYIEVFKFHFIRKILLPNIFLLEFYFNLFFKLL